MHRYFGHSITVVTSSHYFNKVSWFFFNALRLNIYLILWIALLNTKSMKCACFSHFIMGFVEQNHTRCLACYFISSSVQWIPSSFCSHTDLMALASGNMAESHRNSVSLSDFPPAPCPHNSEPCKRPESRRCGPSKILFMPLRFLGACRRGCSVPHERTSSWPGSA